MVEILTLPNCQGCKLSKRRMSEKGIAFKEIDMSRDEAAFQKAKDLGYSAAPVLIAPDGRHWSGLRMDLIDSLA